MDTSTTFLVNTDGACSGNPGPGGWAFTIRDFHAGNLIFKLAGGQKDTTNNRMELTAAIRALEALPIGAAAVLYSDSQYVIKGITEWLPGWKAKGWKTASKKPVLNQDLWQQLDREASVRKVDFRWVRGHNGDEFNEEVDRMAAAEAARS